MQKGTPGTTLYWQKRGMAVRHIRALVAVAAIVVIFSGCSLFTQFTPVPLVVGESTRADVVSYFESEPFEYAWGGETFTVDTLPTVYEMNYKAGRGAWFEVVMVNIAGTDVVNEIRINSEDYRAFGSLTVGMTREEVFAIVGNPASTVTGVPNAGDVDVFYQDIAGEEGYCYYSNSSTGVRMFFTHNLTNAVYIWAPTDTLERIK